LKLGDKPQQLQLEYLEILGQKKPPVAAATSSKQAATSTSTGATSTTS